MIAGCPYDSTATVDAIDLLGNGTSCLVWSSPLPSHARQPLRYCRSDRRRSSRTYCNRSTTGSGARRAVDYASSTTFYLRDRAAGRPWVTRVPFPVQVVERVDHHRSRSRGNQLRRRSIRYHHGFYDGVEREFRGFGMVEQTRHRRRSRALESQGRFPAGAAYVPPARTRTWFHTGAFSRAPH